MSTLSQQHIEAFGEAGPSPVWFHGKVDRNTVESRLVGMPEGTFLIRDSGSTPGNFVLSVTESGHPNHYLIERMGQSQYKIGDETFQNLAFIISNFQRKPLDSTCLTAPLPLDSAFESGVLNPNFLFSAKAKFNFNAKDPEDLSFRKGEMLNILQQHEESWWRAQSQRTLQIGAIPANYVERVEAAVVDQPMYGNDELDAQVQIGSGDLYGNEEMEQSLNSAQMQFGGELYGNDNLANQPVEETVDITPVGNFQSSLTQEAQAALLTEFLPRVTSEARPDERPKFLVARALMDRNAAGYDKTALSFKEGDTIQITKQHENGLWEGKILDGEGALGHFPFVHVELMDCALFDNDLQTRSQKFEIAMDSIYGNI